MIVQARDGRYITVRRRWLPWRLQRREFDGPADPFSFVDVADGPGSLVVGLLLGIAAFLFGGIVISVLFLAGEALLLVLLLVPLLLAARVLWVLPWIVEADYAKQALGVQRVRGWRQSGAKIREIAAAYERGEDPFPPSHGAHRLET